MQAAVNALQAALQTPGGVLLCGEPGSGREVFARAIHTATHEQFDGSVERLLRTSMRRTPNGRPFVVVDCGVIENLENRLFGCDLSGSSGEVNGLDRIKEGSKLHQALDGTVLFRQLTEMPGGLQARLSRILRDGQVRVEKLDGQTVTQAVSVRAIATIDLPAGDERVLLELRKRLGQSTISVPPLRERREDIPALVRYILRDFCASQSIPAKSASTQAMQLLTALPWQGNIKELRGLLRTLVLKVPGQLIRLADILANTRLEGGANTFSYGGPLKEARERFEREYVAAVLAQHQGRMAEAAKALGIQRTNLYRKVRQLSVQRRRASA
jgi:two-component system, NtrC family, nitrogen regulation response regulator NtrX